MTNKISVTEAEARLKNLEQHNHAADVAFGLMKRAERRAEEDKEHDPQSAKEQLVKAAAFKKQYEEAVQAHADSGVTDREIDDAAQVVLDARGESHGEVNVLPSGVSIDDFNKAKAEAA